MRRYLFFSSLSSDIIITIMCATSVESAPTSGDPVSEWHPRRPVLSTLRSCWRLTPVASSWGQPSRVWSRSFLRPSLLPAFLSPHDVPGGGQLHGFASSDVPGLICPRTLSSVFLAVPGVHRALLYHISGESVVFPVSLHCPASVPLRGSWEGEGVDDPSLVSDDISALGDLSQILRHCPSGSQPCRDFLAAVSI